MRRAIEHCHRRGIAVIPYIGIVPGRSPLLRYEDLAAPYDKNWDLQDFTFYASAGRWQEVLPYLTESWCRRYGIDDLSDALNGLLGVRARGRGRPVRLLDRRLDQLAGGQRGGAVDAVFRGRGLDADLVCRQHGRQ